MGKFESTFYTLNFLSGETLLNFYHFQDSQGEVTVHETLSEIQKTPTVIIRHAHKVIVKVNVLLI